MGITYIEATVTGASGKEARERFLVDSGATYTVLPKTVWEAIGLEPKRRMDFSLADGTLISRDISECLISFDEHEGHTPVVLGEVGDEALLGVITLENLGLVLNPFKRTLQPMRMLMV